MHLETPLAVLDFIAPPRLRQLQRFGLSTLGQLLTHFPRRYEDRTRFDRFPSGESDEAVCVCGVVKKTNLRRIRGSQKMFDVLLEEESAHALSPPLVCRWFNAHWVEKMIAIGHQLIVYGKPKRTGAHIVIAHPEFEVAEPGAEESVHLNRLAPIHGATEGLSARLLRQIIFDALSALPDDAVETLLPPALKTVELAWALHQIHFPDTWESLAEARRHLVLTEFFEMQLRIAAQRAEQAALPGAVHAATGALAQRLHAALPFPLTRAQQRSIREIRADLAAPRPMNRLLHGDVGSGKTLVALSAMLEVVEAGFQAALMAPTQILAEQHFLVIKQLCEPLGLRVALRTGARREDVGVLPLFAAETSPRNADALHEGPHIFIGTHALLFDGAGISHLGLAVIDEQHKFGVLQRARLRDQGAAPDVLVMTATPIPRTLTMTLYGDLDLSVLDELPAHRGKIVTVARDVAKLPEAVKFVRAQLAEGRQAYIVYPLVEDSEKLVAKSASAEFEKWRELLAPMRCELLHGRVEPEEKEVIMERFRRGETQALIATTVIEVGIDVPNANLMLIENAERFGLAQLHQLRGRIGRGAHKSYCILLNARPEDPAAVEKLEILVRTGNGFEIAEEDLRLRRTGDLLGTAQTGASTLKIGDPVADIALMQAAREAALALFAEDPRLERAENRRFRKVLAAHAPVALSQVS